MNKENSKLKNYLNNNENDRDFNDKNKDSSIIGHQE